MSYYTPESVKPEMVLVESMLETLWRTGGGRLAELPLRRWSAVDTSQSLHGSSFELKGVRVIRGATFQSFSIQGMPTSEQLTRKTFNHGKVNETWKLMVGSARSHEALELITVQNKRREPLPHYIPLIVS